MDRFGPATTEMADPSTCCKSMEFYRQLITSYVEQHEYANAIFWADKLITLSAEQDQDIYLLAQCYYFSGQYQRGASLLLSRKFDRCNLHFRCLTAKCLYSAKDYIKALDVLDLENSNIVPGYKFRESTWTPHGISATAVKAQIFLLRGKVYEALMNRILAAQNYKAALHSDIYCFEAFQLLTQHHMLSYAEETDLFELLPFEKDCANGDVEFVKYLYSIHIKKYSTVATALSPVQFAVMRKNLDVLTGDAERLYYNGDFLQAYKVCTRVMTEDPLHLGCFPVYIACLVELKKVTELFKVSHKLVEAIPNTALGWYAVGSYYFAIGKQDVARRNLNKSMCIDPVFGPSWLLFGHSFAQEGEHDQAMAAYFKATQLMKGCHLPLLHVGMECGISNNPQLAMKFLQDALTLAPKDPTIHHEMGVIKFNEKRYPESHAHFSEALALVEKPNMKHFQKKWEPLYNNLGHVCRKLKKYNEAYSFHQKALLLKPTMASTHSAIGVLHAIKWKTNLAIDAFHKALSLQRDDAFSNTMLRQVIDKMVEDCKDDSRAGKVICLDKQESEDSIGSEDSTTDESDAETLLGSYPFA